MKPISAILASTLMFLVASSLSCSRQDMTPTDHQDVTRFLIIHVRSPSVALGLYKLNQDGDSGYRLDKVVHPSIDNHFPEYLSANEVKQGMISQLVNETSMLLVAKSNEEGNHGMAAMPIVDGKVVYFVSQPPQPRFLLTVALKELVEYLDSHAHRR